MKQEKDLIAAKNSNSRFGARGWVIVLLGMFMYFCSASVIVEGSNIFVPAYSAAHGVSEAGLYSIATIASLVAIPLSVLAGIHLTKRGPRRAMALWWAGGAVGLAIMGLSSSYVGYAIGRILLNMASTGGITIAYNGLIANWFPTKKDLVQGYATMGSNLSTAFAVLLFSFLVNTVAINNTFFICAAGFLLVALLSALLTRDNPEDVGCFPDNDRTMTREQADELLRIGEEYKRTSPWTIKRLLRTKQVWQIAIGYGIILLITVGVLSTFVTTLSIKGLELNVAISMMTVAAVVAIPCSYLWGWFGARLGTKKASLMLYGVIFLCIVFMLIPGSWTAYAAVALLGCFIGAGNNLTPAIIGSVFGRYDFSRAMTVIIPIWSIIVAFATTVVGVPQSITGSYTASYCVLLALAVIGFVLVWTLDEHCIGRADLVEKGENAK